MSPNKLKELYESKSDFELLSVLKVESNYTEDTIRIVKEIINQRGGLDTITNQVEAELKKNQETDALNRVVMHLLKNGHGVNEIKSKIKYSHLNEAEIDVLINENHSEFKLLVEDKKITIKSLLGAIIGGIIGGVVGGILWGFMMMKSGYIFYIIGLGLFLISYFFIRLFSRKSIENKATIIMTILSVILALIIGQLIFEFYGLAPYLE